jgi:hypothetical protein
MFASFLTGVLAHHLRIYLSLKFILVVSCPLQGNLHHGAHTKGRGLGEEVLYQSKNSDTTSYFGNATEADCRYLSEHSLQIIQDLTFKACRNRRICRERSERQMRQSLRPC